MKTFLIALLTAVSSSGFAQENPKFMNLLAVNGLNMRSEPDARSRVVTKVAYGKRIEILQKTKVELQLGWVKSHWYKVKYRGREGFIFGGYLSELSAPEAIETKRLAALLPTYCSSKFKVKEAPVVTKEVVGAGDTLKHTLVLFANGAELEIESQKNRESAMLILPGATQEAYILLEAMLKQNGMKEELNNLRFVQNQNGELQKVSNADGTISIKPYAEDAVAVMLTSH